MKRDPFISTLIEKLNKLKRDREVREKLEDSLEEFKAFRSNCREITPKVSKKQPVQYENQNKIPQKNTNTKYTQSKRIVYRTVTEPAPKTSERRRPKTISTSTSTDSTSTNPSDFTVVGYCFAGNPVPYSTKVRGTRITLAHFKVLVNRRGDFRYFFKRYCNEFGTSIVFEEVTNDEEALPLWDGKIFALIEEVEEYRL